MKSIFNNISINFSDALKSLKPHTPQSYIKMGTTLVSGVSRGSVVKCLTRNPGVLGSSRTGSSGFFRGNVLGQDTSEPQPSTGETQERHE